MDILMAIVVFLLAKIISQWPTNWQTKVLLFVVLLVLALFGFFGTGYWPHGRPSLR